MKITLVSRDNGVGLSTDMNLLSELFTHYGHSVNRVDWRVLSMPRCDVVIFLELYSPRLIRYSRRRIGIFNPEWFMASWKNSLRLLDQVWAKSQESKRAFSLLVPPSRVHYTGFLTQDMYDPNVPRIDECLHVQGHSQDKNTERVLEAWRRNRDLPPLTIVGQHPVPDTPGVQWTGRVPSDQLRNLMNSRRIHICPSKVEGWAHYISEALTAKAHVITVNMPPMNEHVQPGWGTLLRPSVVHPRGITQACDVSSRDIAAAVRSALKVSPQQKKDRGTLSREHALRRNAAFARKAMELLETK